MRPGYAGHDHVGDQNVDGFVVFLRDDLGFLAIAGLQELISLLLEVPVHDAAHTVFVLHQQNSGRGVAPGGGREALLALDIAHLPERGQPRQQDLECRAQAGLAAGGDMAAALHHDTVHHG